MTETTTLQPTVAGGGVPSPVAQLEAALTSQREAFARERDPSLEARRDRLDRLLRLTATHDDAIIDAVSADFGHRSRHETDLADIFVVLSAIRHTRRHVRRWMKARRVATPLHLLPATSEVIRQPLGVVGVISPWNYPLQLALLPVAAALAAGNRAMLKPSELTPRFSALLQQIVAESFAPDEFAVFPGDVELGRAFSRLPFDHLFFTGSTAVGRQVARAAAENLTPVTLELGGKSPAIVDVDCDLPEAARRIVFAKLLNAGQTCVAPDYLLVPRARLDALVGALREAVGTMYPTLAGNPDYTSIVTDRHYRRLTQLVDDARVHGATAIPLTPAPPDAASRRFPPTLLQGVDDEMAVMREEIFGPLLPLLPYDSLDDAIAYVNARPRPLALYWFGRDAAHRERVLRQTISGGVTINDACWHVCQEYLPFGGVGASGMGAYHGERGFLAFTKEKAVLHQSRINGIALLFRPPYGRRFEAGLALLKRFFDPLPTFAREAAVLYGLMQDRPLLISSLIEHANVVHPRAEIVTRTVEGPVHRCTYSDVHGRSKQAAQALVALGIEAGDRVATLAWNTYRHLELYFGVSGMGAVLHTINPRLFPEQIEYIVNHAEDKLLCFDLTFLPLVEKLAPALRTVRAFVALTDRAHLPPTKLPNLLCYDELIAAQDGRFDWPTFDERTASSLCYTSGTTGNPKGVLYSHRSTVLHSFAVCSVDGIALGAAETTLLVVPMFHVNAWGAPYAGAMCGAKLVLPGPGLDGKSVYEIMRDEQVTLALGVPTVWLNLFNHIDAAKLDPRKDLCLRRLIIGGSAAPRAMSERFATEFGAFVAHGWGMTEMSPLGTVCNLLPKHRDLALAQCLDIQEKQGRSVYGVELRIVDADDRPLPHDGKARGRLMVRGPWVAASYYRADDGPILDADGYFDTGDVATIDPDGYAQIVDRAKDVIKSGGEWISSIDLECAAMGHPAIAEAAVIGVAHPKWQERPLLIAVKKQGQELTRDDVLSFLASKVAKWWLPDDVVFVDELPHTATGKLQKMKLRETFRDYKLPTT